MTLIMSDSIDYEDVKPLEQILLSFGLEAQAKDAEGFGNARVDVQFSSLGDDVDTSLVIMIWVDPSCPNLLKFRVILFDKIERDKLEKNNELWHEINRIVDIFNRNAFGYVYLSNIVGITLDYSMTMEGGITGSILGNSAKELAKAANNMKSSILDEIEFMG